MTSNLRCPAATDPLEWVKNYDIVWTTPGVRNLDSMPLGGGSLSMNALGTAGGVMLTIGSPDAWNDSELLSKIGRIRIVCSPNPFAHQFRQHLDLLTNSVYISGVAGGDNRVCLHIWVDSLHPVIHIDGTADGPVTVTASAETPADWRMDSEYDGNRAVWLHRNADISSARAASIQGWGLESIADQVPDPLGCLTYGGQLSGDGFIAQAAGSGVQEGVAYSAVAIESIAPMKSFHLRATMRIAQDASAADFKKQLLADDLDRAASSAADWNKVREWWQGFWDRSHIVIDPGCGESNLAWKAGRNYQLFRAMLAANATGRFPTLFNGGAFTCEADPNNGDWSGCRFMAQNERLLYWPLLKSGDYDLLKVGLDFYQRNAALQAERIKHYWGIDGIVYDESLGVFGLGNFPSTDGLDKYDHLKHHFTSGNEFVYMMLLLGQYSDQDISHYVPTALGIIHFYDNYYRMMRKQQAGSELGPDGKLVIFPGNGLELYGGTVNSSDAVSGLIAISDALIDLPPYRISAADWAYVKQFRATLPDISTRIYRDVESLSPAESWASEGGQENAEMPQLYPVFPFGLYGVDKPNLELARNTWWYGNKNDYQRRAYCWYQGNIFTAELGLTNEAKEYALRKLLWPELEKGGPVAQTRYPAFYYPPNMANGSKFCQEPDMDHGGSAMVGLQEMLLQTNGRRILLFPAWPKEWDVDFKLHAPYQTTIVCSFRAGKIVNLIVTPKSRRSDVIDLSGQLPPPTPPIDAAAELVDVNGAG